MATVVTGIGVVAPNGLGTDAYWSATCAGRDGIGPVRRFDPTGYPARLAGEVPGFDAGEHLPGRLLPQIDHMTGLALVAADWALADAVSHLEHAVRLDPGDRESRALLDVLGAGGSVSDNSALKQLLADDTFVTMSFGRVCLEQGLVDEAAQIFLRLLGRDLRHVGAREGLEEALRLKTQRRKGS